MIEKTEGAINNGQSSDLATLATQDTVRRQKKKNQKKKQKIKKMSNTVVGESMFWRRNAASASQKTVQDYLVRRCSSSCM